MKVCLSCRNEDPGLYCQPQGTSGFASMCDIEIPKNIAGRELIFCLSLLFHG
jgi:hypothetical protein